MNSERGSTVMLIAVSILMLFGMVSLAIDGSLGFDDRRGSQNAADNAALAAAWESCNPKVAGAQDEVAAALEVAADNGYADTPGGFPKVDVSASNEIWTVEIQERNDGVFGRTTPFAPDQLDIVSAASARCIDEGFAGGYALFSETSLCPISGVQNPSPDLDVAASSVTIKGNVHANDDIKLHPSTVVDGEVTYIDNANVGSVSAEQYFGTAKTYPIDIEISEYQPSPIGARAAAAGSKYHAFPGDVGASDLGTVASGVLTISNPGIYYAEGDFNLQSVEIVLDGDAATEGVTFVAKGTISIKEAGNLTGFDYVEGSSGPKLLFFSTAPGPTATPNSKCNTTAIKVSGSNVAWEGMMYAPNGGVAISASDNSTLDGSIIAHWVNLSGSEITLNFIDHPDSDPNFRVELIS